MASSTLPSLQLPTFTPLEPLTAGTNLPPVSECDLDPITPPVAEPSRTPSLASSRVKPDFETPPSKVARTSGSTPNGTASPTTSHRSNGRPVSRNFLSRMSYQSANDDKSSMFSSTPSTLVAEGRKKPKRTSWWKKIRHNSTKRQSILVPQHEMLPKVVDHEQYHPAYRAPYSTPPAPAPVQSGPPPPRLPDDLFGKNLSTLDGDDMFKDLK